MKYRSKYEFSIRNGHEYHDWSVIARHIGIHLHIIDMGEDDGKEAGERYSGGIEIHYRQPPDYMKDEAPSHDNCWLLKAPCWHDGSSMQVTDKWIPRWRALAGRPDEHVQMLEFLEIEVESRTNTLADDWAAREVKNS